MKKWISFIMIAVVISAGVTACGKKSEGSKEPEAPAVNEKVEDETTNKEPEKVEEPAETPVETPQNEAEESTLLVYSGNEDATGFKTQEIKLPEITPEAVLSELCKQGVLLSDISMLGFSQTENEGKKVIDLDLSAAFSTFLKTQGTSGEYIAIGSICNTYLEAYDCERIRITVEGETLATGHAEYPGYMSTFK